MTESQDKLIADLTEWGNSRGNCVFVMFLGQYYELLKKRESKDDTKTKTPHQKS